VDSTGPSSTGLIVDPAFVWEKFDLESAVFPTLALGLIWKELSLVGQDPIVSFNQRQTKQHPNLTMGRRNTTESKKKNGITNPTEVLLIPSSQILTTHKKKTPKQQQ
jgi:hypothetical protein